MCVGGGKREGVLESGDVPSKKPVQEPVYFLHHFVSALLLLLLFFFFQNSIFGL